MKALASTRLRALGIVILPSAILLASCAAADVRAPVPILGTGADPNRWASIPAGAFFQGQFDRVAAIDYDYQMMAYPVTYQQYAAFLTEALASGKVKVEGDRIAGYYPGDEFNAARHEERIEAGDHVYVPLDDPSLRLAFDGTGFTVTQGWEMHPATMVSWFGARGFCDFYGWRLPTELEWEKAARGPIEGPDGNRPFPWGDQITIHNANYYVSRDPFEDMTSFGSRTTPVGFYNGRTYNGYVTLDSPSPYGVYDMAGNVWQWTGDDYPDEHYRYLRGGSKDTYDMDLRIWVRNSATPTYMSPGVGFRCVR